MNNFKVVALVAAMAGALLVSPAYAVVDRINIVDGGEGGLKADGGVSGSATITQRSTTILPENFPTVTGDFLGQPVPQLDVATNGYNSDSGLYEFKTVLAQTAVLPLFGVTGRANIDSILKISIAEGKGFIMSLSCEIQSPQNICAFVNSSNGKVRKLNVMTAAEIQAKFSKKFEDVTAADLSIPSNLGVGIIKFDEANPLKFNVKIKDIAGAVLTQSFEMRSVPVPAAAWLFGSAMLGLFGFKKIKK